MQRDLNLSCGQVEAVVALLPAGAFFGSLLGGRLIDRFGRKRSIGNFTMTIRPHVYHAKIMILMAK